MHRFSRGWLVALGMILARSAAGHWVNHPELPRWAQRGRLHWCLNYARTDRKLVDLFVDHGQNLVHGGAFDSPETAEYARRRGLRYMPYVCSRTVTTREIAANPPLKDAVVLRTDGSEFLAYNNPVRRYGSLRVPAWPEYVRNRTRRVWDLPDVAAIFFDNAFWPGDDHNPTAVRAWKAWAAKHGIPPGNDVPSIYHDPLAAASRAFSLDSLIRYHAMLRDFCHGHTPPLLNCPNAGNAYGLAAAEAGAIDLFFYETMTHPPFVNNAFRYKAGLAVTHGRPTALLAYLPPRIAAERGVRTWHEGMHHYFYPSSPLPEEFALAAAEGAACGGTYVVNYNLFPSLSITDLTDPFCKRVHRAVKQAYTFIDANEDLYAPARPGSDVAVLYSPITDIQNRRLQNTHVLGQSLTGAGIPYEVVVPSDLAAPAGLAGVRTLVIPNVAYADEQTAAGVLAFVQAGGRAIITGRFAVYDRFGRAAHRQAARKVMAVLRIVDRPVRSWELDGFEPEGPDRIRVRGKTGRARTRYDGPGGRSVAHICILDENDGTSSFRLSVAGETVYRGKLDAEDERPHWFTTPPFDIRPGDTVELRVDADAGERGRVSAVVLAAAESRDQGAVLGRGRVVYSPRNLEELPPGRRLDLLRPAVRLKEPGKVFINVLDVPERGLRTIHLVNYDFRYEVAHPGLYADDDGQRNARMFFGGQPVVVRKRIRIADPGKVGEPVLQIHGFATRDCTGRLVITVNGRRAGVLDAARMQGSAWYEVPVDRRLLTPDNIIEIRAEGELDGMKKWIQIDIDTDTHHGNSWFSTDGGRTFTAGDLSTDRKAQTGEYMVRIRDKHPGGPRDPDNLVENPGFEDVRTPHAETRLTVVAAQDLEIETRGADYRACLAISPDGPPRWVPVALHRDTSIIRAPRVRIYTVLVLARDRAALEPVRSTQLRAAGWTLPPVTEPLRPEVTNWRGYGQGFQIDGNRAHSGAYSIRCANTGASEIRGAVQTFHFEKDPPRRLRITAWSRCENVSGKADAHYSVYVDAVCTDGAVFNGRHAPFRTGTHDWEQAVLRLDPPAPIRSMRLYLLFRKHAGTAWFDDVRMVRE